MKTKRFSRLNKLGILLARPAGAAVLASLLSACAATSQGQVNLQQETPTEQATPSGAAQFLGSDASLLQPGAKGQAAFLYINPDARWSNYNKVLLKPVEFWNAADSGVSAADRKMLTSYFYEDLQENLQKKFTAVDQPGPDVVTVQVAIINAEGATPGLRSISLVVPQARVLNYAQSMVTSHAAFAGSAEAAFKITDSTTGQLLAEAVDKRIGDMAFKEAAQIHWGDAEAAMDYWSQKITERALALGAGNPAALIETSASN